MKLILDTHLLLWGAEDSPRLSRAARTLINDPEHELFFSAASLWEVAIKHALGKTDFHVDAGVLRRALLDNGYLELPILGDHATTLESLPLIHKDPFDRILIAQAITEGITLLTVDAEIARYPGPIRSV
jgi:PIN domain nuclease of toxin-antitoxin system